MVNAAQNHSFCPALKLIILLMASRDDAPLIFCKPRRRRITISYSRASNTGLRCGEIQTTLMNVSGIFDSRCLSAFH